jgi:hypothetical protein
MRLKILLLAGAVVTSSASAHAAIPCSAIPLDVSGPRPMLSIRINGRPPFKAIFDTGNMSTTIDLNQADQLGLVKSGPLKEFNTPGAIGYQTLLKNVKIGDLAIGNLSAAALPAMMPGMAAVIGPSAFGSRYVSVDLANSQLRICPRTAANRPAGHPEPYTPAPVILPAIRVSAGAQSVAAHIDTGSPLTLSFPMKYADLIKLAEPLKKIGVARSHFGEKPIYAAKIAGPVKVGELTLDSPRAFFSDVVPEPNVGGELLRRMTITIDPVGKLAWTAAVPTPPIP